MTISHNLSGRLGNHCLQIYKTFLFALQRGIPFDCVKFSKRTYCPLFENIKRNFIDRDELFKIDFNRVFENCNKLDNIEFSKETDNILFTKCRFIYPNTPREFRLFNYIFDAPTMHRQMMEKYDGMFNQKTVGLTIRRGDFLRLQTAFKNVTEEQVVNLVRKVIDDNLGLVKVVVTSDDIDWCKEKLSCFGDKVEFFYDTPENTLMCLSFCDEVICNGAIYRCINGVEGKWESTFGQIAQCLCISRHFLPPVALKPEEIAGSCQMDMQGDVDVKKENTNDIKP